jgi:hypothetical protein
MSRKGFLIGLAVSVIAIAVVVVVVAVVAGAWIMKSRKGNTAEEGRTAVGTPKGLPTTKSIGQEGGTIASTDGRITVSVPAHAVSGPMDFSVQPLTNMAPGGVGDAYRMEPGRLTFSQPVKLSFKFNDDDTSGAAPETFTVAYQDRDGLWQPIKNVELDKQNKIYSVLTSHFSDYSFKANVRIEPRQQTLRPGQSTYLEVFGCDPSTVTGLIKRTIGLGDEEQNGGCHFGYRLFGIPALGQLGEHVSFSWKVDHGTIETGKQKVKYTAPATIPPNNVATATVPWYSYDLPGYGGNLSASIIITVPYKVSGQDGPVRYSGTICSFEKPFKVTANDPLGSYDINFVPVGHLPPFRVPNPGKGPRSFSPDHGALPEYGMFSFKVNRVYTLSGTGSYLIKGIETTHPMIICRENSQAMYRGVRGAGTGVASIQLTPLDTNECDGK